MRMLTSSAQQRRGPADFLVLTWLLLQVYLILDEFILGGEFEETSKKVSPFRLFIEPATSTAVHVAVAVLGHWICCDIVQQSAALA